MKQDNMQHLLCWVDFYPSIYILHPPQPPTWLRSWQHWSGDRADGPLPSTHQGEATHNAGDGSFYDVQAVFHTIVEAVPYGMHVYPLLGYFEQTWSAGLNGISAKFPHSYWNQTDRVATDLNLTNNYCESFNRKLSTDLGHYNPTIYILLLRGRRREKDGQVTHFVSTLLLPTIWGRRVSLPRPSCFLGNMFLSVYHVLLCNMTIYFMIYTICIVPASIMMIMYHIKYLLDSPAVASTPNQIYRCTVSRCTVHHCTVHHCTVHRGTVYIRPALRKSIINMSIILNL